MIYESLIFKMSAHDIAVPAVPLTYLRRTVGTGYAVSRFRTIGDFCGAVGAEFDVSMP